MPSYVYMYKYMNNFYLFSVFLLGLLIFLPTGHVLPRSLYEHVGRGYKNIRESVNTVFEYTRLGSFTIKKDLFVTPFTTIDKSYKDISLIMKTIFYTTSWILGTAEIVYESIAYY